MLSGERTDGVSGSISIEGTDASRLGVSARRRLGLASVPEERNGHAAVPAMSLTENAILSARARKGLASRGLLKLGAAKAFAGSVIAAFSVKARGPASVASSLSGGNLQKFIMGREIGQDPAVLLVSQPTWGVDAGAASSIRQALADLAEKGAAILLVSQDLDELLQISDRIAVINGGRLSKAMEVAEVSIDELGLLMGGVHGTDAEAPRHVA